MRKIKGHDGLYKRGAAVVSVDRNVYTRAKAQRAEREDKERRFEALENKVDKLTSMLEELLNK